MDLLNKRVETLGTNSLFICMSYTVMGLNLRSLHQRQISLPDKVHKLLISRGGYSWIELFAHLQLERCCGYISTPIGRCMTQTRIGWSAGQWVALCAVEHSLKLSMRKHKYASESIASQRTRKRPLKSGARSLRYKRRTERKLRSLDDTQRRWDATTASPAPIALSCFGADAIQPICFSPLPSGATKFARVDLFAYSELWPNQTITHSHFATALRRWASIKCDKFGEVSVRKGGQQN